MSDKPNLIVQAPQFNQKVLKPGVLVRITEQLPIGRCMPTIYRGIVTHAHEYTFQIMYYNGAETNLSKVFSVGEIMDGTYTIDILE